MPEAAPTLDKSPSKIREMFAGVAPRYDFLNRLLSGYLDSWWRRKAAAAVVSLPGDEILDLCCGTGDQALALARRGGRVVAVDFCLPMLALARPKLARGAPGPPRLATADAMALPFAGASFDGATVSFGLRNVADLDTALGEILRVLRPGGRLAVLEPAIPRSALVRGPYLLYFRHLLPRIGALFSPRGSAYAYLTESVEAFPQREAFVGRMVAAGFIAASFQDLTAGTVCLYTGRKAP